MRFTKELKYWRRVFLVAACLMCSVGARSVPAQSAWIPIQIADTRDLISVYFTSADRGWIAGDKGFLASTSDGGLTWNEYPLNTSEDISEIFFRNDDNGYLVAGRKMFLTRDGGRTWRETTIYRAREFGDRSPEFLSIKFANKRLGLAIGSVLNRKGDVVDSLVMRTVDGGETWQRVAVAAKTELFHLAFEGDDRVWIVGDAGVILASVDGGATWARQSSGTSNELYNVDFRNASDGYVVGGKGTILRTTNGGASWQKALSPTVASLMRVDFADDKNGWIVGYGGTILRSTDRGLSWTKQPFNAKENLYGLYMTKKYGYAVGAKGRLARFER